MLKLGTLATAKTVASLCERSSIIDRTYERVFFTTRDNAINGINRWKRSIRTYFNYYYQNEGHISLSKHGLNLALFHLWNQSKALYIYRKRAVLNVSRYFCATLYLFCEVNAEKMQNVQMREWISK